MCNTTYIKKIDGKWYAFAGDKSNDNVYSIGNDNPRDGGRWFARWTDSGIRYVASGLETRSGAYKKASRYGSYCGEIRN